MKDYLSLFRQTATQPKSSVENSLPGELAKPTKPSFVSFVSDHGGQIATEHPEPQQGTGDEVSVGKVPAEALTKPTKPTTAFEKTSPGELTKPTKPILALSELTPATRETWRRLGANEPPCCGGEWTLQDRKRVCPDCQGVWPDADLLELRRYIEAKAQSLRREAA